MPSLKTPDKCLICHKMLCFGWSCEDECVYGEQKRERGYTLCKLRNDYMDKYHLNLLKDTDQKCHCSKEEIYNYYKGLYEQEKQQNMQATHCYYVNIKRMKLYIKYLERRVRMLGGHNAWKK